MIYKESVKFAVENGVSTKGLENLTVISYRTNNNLKKKQKYLLNSLALYQSQQFIEYKARSSGLIAEYVNPEYTSKTCCRYNISLKIIEMHLNSYVRFVVLNLVPI